MNTTLKLVITIIIIIAISALWGILINYLLPNNSIGVVISLIGGGIIGYLGAIIFINYIDD
jgi:hypothetical protein